MSQQQNIETIHRLSPMQEGLLFHSLEGSRTGVYFNQFTCLLDGAVDAARFKAAWDQAAKRHPVLRSLITWERRDHPLQVVRHQVTLPWTEADWRDSAAEEQEVLWQKFLAEDRSKGFNLAQAPIMRFALVQVAEDRTRFLWSFHHILLDGWSLRLVFDEMLRIYQQGGQVPALDPSVPYADFIAWLGKEDRKAAEVFFTETLKGFKGAPPPPMASSEAQRVADAQAGTKVRTQTLSAELTERLVAIARENRLTLNTLLVGAWAILLGRYAGQADIVFGTTVSGRAIDLESVERIAGPLLNTLPLRVEVQPDQQLSEWLRDVQSRQLSLRAYEQTPLSAIQRWSGLPQGQSLFETVLVFESFPCRDDGWKSDLGFKVSGEEFIEWSNYPLALLVVPDECLQLILVYDSGRFSEAAPGRLLDQLEALMTAMAEGMTLPVSALSMLSEDERRLVVDRWNETQLSFPSDVSIQALIEPWAEQRPDAIAVASETEELTYAELDRRAKGLAHRLKGRGIGKDIAVPIFMERSADAIVAMLGVIYAGGAYVPLDPTYPEQRVQQVLEDVGAAVASSGGRLLVLTQAHLKDQLSSGDFDVMAVSLESTDNRPDDPGEALVPAAPQDLAYIIHTSGSTGRPKGVMVSHRNLVNSTHARVGAYPDDVGSFLLLSSIATDSSVAGIFWALTRGATLVLPRGRQEQDIQQLVALIERRRVTHTLCVPYPRFVCDALTHSHTACHIRTSFPVVERASVAVWRPTLTFDVTLVRKLCQACSVMPKIEKN